MWEQDFLQKVKKEPINFILRYENLKKGTFTEDSFNHKMTQVEFFKHCLQLAERFEKLNQEEQRTTYKITQISIK